MIGDIFGRAIGVLEWLGPHSVGTELLFGEYPSRLPGTDPNHAPSQQERGLAGGWFDLLQRPYWKLTWIVQEILLGGLSLSIMAQPV